MILNKNNLQHLMFLKGDKQVQVKFLNRQAK